MFHKHVKIMFLRYGYKSISGVTRCQVFPGFCKCSQKHQAIKFLKRMPQNEYATVHWCDLIPGFAFSNTLTCLMLFFA